MSCYLAPDGFMSAGYPGPAFEMDAPARVCDCGHAETRHLIGAVHRCLEPGCTCRALRFWTPDPDRAVKP